MRKHLKVFNSLDGLNNYYDEAKGYFVGYKKQNRSEVRYEKLYTSNGNKTVVLRNSINNKDMIVKESDYYKRYIFDNRYIKCDYLTFTGNGTIKILPIYPSVAETYFYGRNFYYSGDGISWTQYTLGDTLSVLKGQKIMMRGNFDYLGYDGPNDIWRHNFVMTGTIYASGCVNSLLSGYPNSIYSPSYAFPGLFQGCTSLITAPDLPATNIYGYCYTNMFYGCTNLKNAPILPALWVYGGSYAHMFDGCSNLSYVKALFTHMTNDSATQNWLSGVSGSGTFVKNKNAEWDITGANGVPEGWTIEYE